MEKDHFASKRLGGGDGDGRIMNNRWNLEMHRLNIHTLKTGLNHFVTATIEVEHSFAQFLGLVSDRMRKFLYKKINTSTLVDLTNASQLIAQ
jgi:hypothetical protein